jgi:hypothetical protein
MFFITKKSYYLRTLKNTKKILKNIKNPSDTLTVSFVLVKM